MKSLAPLIIIVICAGMYFVYIQPTGSEVKSLSSEKNGYINILTKTRELTQKREDILTVYNEIPAEDIDRLRKIIPETFSPILFLNDLSEMVKRYGMTVGNFKTNEPKSETRNVIIQSQGDAYKTTVVTFNLVGTYNQFLNVLRDLESSLRLIDVVGINVRSANARSTGETPLEYLLEVKTYSLR